LPEIISKKGLKFQPWHNIRVDSGIKSGFVKKKMILMEIIKPERFYKPISEIAKSKPLILK
jgi:hypothetical protein